jgi:hypothetical protein
LQVERRVELVGSSVASKAGPTVSWSIAARNSAAGESGLRRSTLSQKGPVRQLTSFGRRPLVDRVVGAMSFL